MWSVPASMRVAPAIEPYICVFAAFIIEEVTHTRADNNQGFGAVRDFSARDEYTLFFSSLQVLF
jgi:hypothetical protein